MRLYILKSPNSVGYIMDKYVAVLARNSKEARRILKEEHWEDPSMISWDIVSSSKLNGTGIYWENDFISNNEIREDGFLF